MKKLLMLGSFFLVLAAIAWMLAGSAAYENRLDTAAIDRLDDAFFTEAEKAVYTEYIENLGQDAGDRGLYFEGTRYYSVTKADGTVYCTNLETEETERLFCIGLRTCGYFVEDEQLYFLSGWKDHLAVKWDKFWGKRDRNTRICRVKRWKYDFTENALQEIEKKTYDEAFRRWRSGADGSPIRVPSVT